MRSESASLSTKGPHNKGKIQEYSVLLSFERLPTKYIHFVLIQRLPRNQSHNIEINAENSSVIFYSSTSKIGEITSCFNTSMKPTSVIAYVGIAARQMKERNINGMLIGDPSS